MFWVCGWVWFLIGGWVCVLVTACGFVVFIIRLCGGCGVGFWVGVWGLGWWWLFGVCCVWGVVFGGCLLYDGFGLT